MCEWGEGSTVVYSALTAYIVAMFSYVLSYIRVRCKNNHYVVE